ncbi:MAG TPA: SDR family NAD(P)-dependent oxidoreductase [Candidatus Binataceae bacterium]|nr:SDR family NAD(P)-dependent oxidoreductase [Candidatus Binataceae bacterium]
MADSGNVFERGRGAIITGGASGIGLATAKRLAALGMRVCIADLDEGSLEKAAQELGSLAPGGASDVLALKTDVSSTADIERLCAAAFDRFGDVAFLMNNAAAFDGGDVFGPLENWHQLINVNLVGVLNGVQRIGRAMVDRKKSGAIVNTGSKQGITTPPGNTVYNVTKAGVKVLTEGLAHTLRNIPNCHITAHLLIPGFTFTGTMSRRMPAKPPAAWTPDQVAERLFDGVTRGDFYILCQDNETTREQDERRILWAAGDIVENRAALSRWDPRYKEAFEAFMSKSPER